jgi:hypothetical protein
MDIWGTLKQAVAKGAPLLANAIVPGSGGLAAALIGGIFGVDPSDPTALTAAVQGASPEQWVALQTAQMEHKEKLVAISADLDKAYLGDRQDARKRDTELQKAGHQNNRANWMIVGDVVGLVACLVMLWLIREAVDAGEIRGIVSTVAGFFGLGLRDAHQFEFGSSRGSKDKDAAVGKATQ